MKLFIFINITFFIDILYTRKRNVMSIKLIPFYQRYFDKDSRPPFSEYTFGELLIFEDFNHNFERVVSQFSQSQFWTESAVPKYATVDFVEAAHWRNLFDFKPVQHCIEKLWKKLSRVKPFFRNIILDVSSLHYFGCVLHYFPSLLGFFLQTFPSLFLHAGNDAPVVQTRRRDRPHYSG